MEDDGVTGKAEAALEAEIIKPNYATNFSFPMSQLPAGNYCLMFKVEHGQITNLTAQSLKRTDAT